MAKQYEQMKLPDRPKRWKQKAFEVMNEAIHTRSQVFLYSSLPAFSLLSVCWYAAAAATFAAWRSIVVVWKNKTIVQRIYVMLHRVLKT